jgi:replicative DNA helicase
MAATLSSELAQLSLMATRSEPVSIGDAVWNVIEEKGNKQNIRRISTGMNALDELIGGLALSRFTIIGAKGGMGKSQLGKQIALNAATAGVKVGIITVEENQEKIAENLLSNASGIENHKIAFGNLHAEDWKQLVDNAAPKLASLPIWIDDTSFNISQIVASANKLASKYKCQIIMVDHIHLIDGQRHNATREREVAAISAALKTTFRKLDVAGVAMAQLNRAGEKGMRPDLTSLRDSGALEQDGDTIILLHREDYYHWKEQNFQADHMLEAIVTKNKDGRQGTALLNFDGATQSVKDWA